MIATIQSAYVLLILYTLPLSNAEFMGSNCSAVILLPEPLYKQTVNCSDNFSLVINNTLIIKNDTDAKEENYVSKLVPTIFEIYVTNTDVGSISLDVTMNLLEKLYLANNSIKNLGKTTFGPFPNLQQLDLSRNQLVDKDIEAFHDLPSLKLLNLSYNTFYSIQSHSFGSLFKLEVLDLSHNSLYGISSNFLSDHQNLRMLYVQYNQLATINLKMPTVLFIDASFNNIRNVNLPDLLQLNISNNKIKDLLNFSDIEINFSNNNITNFKALSEETRYITASYNQIERISTSVFPNSKRLEFLDLSYNIITDIENNALATLTQLKILNLSHNKMVDLKFRVFDGLTAIEILDISFNNFIYLYDIPFAGSFTFDNLGKLDKIILNNNQWSCNFLRQLSKTTFSVIGAHTTCKSDVNDFVIDFDKSVPIESNIPQTNSLDEDEVVKIVQKHLQSNVFNATLFDLVKNLTENNTKSSTTLDYEVVAKIISKYLETDFVNMSIFQHIQNLSRFSKNDQVFFDKLKVDQTTSNKTENSNKLTELFSYILLINTVTTALLLLVIIIALVVLCKRRKYKIEPLYKDY